MAKIIATDTTIEISKIFDWTWRVQIDALFGASPVIQFFRTRIWLNENNEVVQEIPGYTPITKSLSDIPAQYSGAQLKELVNGLPDEKATMLTLIAMIADDWAEQEEAAKIAAEQAAAQEQSQTSPDSGV